MFYDMRDVYVQTIACNSSPSKFSILKQSKLHNHKNNMVPDVKVLAETVKTSRVHVKLYNNFNLSCKVWR